jgi:transcriptional regulator with XRE-family HTH domain
MLCSALSSLNAIRIGDFMATPLRWQALGAELAAARHRTAYTQHHLARRAGISQGAYSQIERGLIRPRPISLGHLAVALGADVTTLASLADYPLEQVLSLSAAK